MCCYPSDFSVNIPGLLGWAPPFSLVAASKRHDQSRDCELIGVSCVNADIPTACGYYLNILLNHIKVRKSRKLVNDPVVCRQGTMTNQRPIITYGSRERLHCGG